MRIPVIAFTIASLPLSATAQTGTVFIPKEVVLSGLAPGEAIANQLWNLRTALNVAALQCQFSPYLHTVDRFRGLIRQHSRELTRAQATMVRYFVRTRAPGGFDGYLTRLSNSFSTLDAQIGFCSTAATAGRDVLIQPVGKLAEIASTEVGLLRASLTPAEASSVPITDVQIAPVEIGLACDRKGRC